MRTNGLTYCDVGSSPGIDTLRFVLGASLMKGITAMDNKIYINQYRFCAQYDQRAVINTALIEILDLIMTKDAHK